MRKVPIIIASTVLLILVIWALLPLLNRARENPGSRMLCPSNLRQLGMALTLYAQFHNKHYPDTLEELILITDFDLTADVFCCPSTIDEKATGQTKQQIVDSIRQAGLPTSLNDQPPPHPRHCSYVYVGKGLTTDRTTDKTILAYEPLANHDGDGSNVLFADGHVEFLHPTEARQLIASIPTPNPTTSATSAPAARQ